MTRRTPGLEEYLESLYKLSDGRAGEPVTTSALASDLGIAPASVTEMVKRLGEQGLVEHVPYKGARLTVSGLAEGAAMVRNHRLWERFLVDVLHMDWDEVHEEACALEHATSPHLAEHLATFAHMHLQNGLDRVAGYHRDPGSRHQPGFGAISEQLRCLLHRRDLSHESGLQVVEAAAGGVGTGP